MIRKFLKRIFLACLLFAALVVGAVTICGVLACSSPGFYATALAEPPREADDEATLQEIEQVMNALELFVQLDAADFQKMRALTALKVSTVGSEKQEAVGVAFETLNRSLGETPDTFAITLTQRHLNAWLKKESGADSGELRRPYIALADDLIRFAVTVDTPAGPAVLSCDFQLAQTNLAELVLELQALRVGRLPIPTGAILKQYLRTNPVLPRGVELTASGGRPTLTITATPNHAKLQLDTLHVIDGEVHLTLRRTNDAVVPAR